jgi:hypothetical protein
MDAGPRDRSGPDHDAGLPGPPASDRLQLEVALLAAAAPAPPDDVRPDSEPGRTVLVAVGDAGLRDYIAQCLRQRPDLRVVEVRPGEDPFVGAHRLAADLVIADGLAIPNDATQASRTPLLLTRDEQSDAMHVSDGTAVAFLLQPFNARRLLDVVARLLGQGSSRA